MGCNNKQSMISLNMKLRMGKWVRKLLSCVNDKIKDDNYENIWLSNEHSQYKESIINLNK